MIAGKDTFYWHSFSFIRYIDRVFRGNADFVMVVIDQVLSGKRRRCGKEEEHKKIQRFFFRLLPHPPECRGKREKSEKGCYSAPSSFSQRAASLSCSALVRRFMTLSTCFAWAG